MKSNIQTSKSQIKTAVAVFSFNRPAYLKQVLDSFEKNQDMDGLDFYLFQDGAVNKFSGRVAADKRDIDACLKFWDASDLPNKQTVQHQSNIGIALCQFEAKEYLFNTLNYERCMFFEDDLVVNKYYFRTLKLLLNQFEFEEKVGAVMCYGNLLKKFSPEENALYAASVQTYNFNLWGWATWRKKWNLVKPCFAEYLQFISNDDYRYRPTKRILEFYKQNGFNITVSSQDAAFYFAMNKKGLFSLNTFLPMAKYIGEVGEHMTAKGYLESGFDLTEPIEKEIDIEKFEGYDPNKFMDIDNSIFRSKVMVVSLFYKHDYWENLLNNALRPFITAEQNNIDTYYLFFDTDDPEYITLAIKPVFNCDIIRKKFSKHIERFLSKQTFQKMINESPANFLTGYNNCAVSFSENKLVFDALTKNELKPIQHYISKAMLGAFKDNDTNIDNIYAFIIYAQIGAINAMYPSLKDACNHTPYMLDLITGENDLSTTAGPEIQHRNYNGIKAKLSDNKIMVLEIINDVWDLKNKPELEWLNIWILNCKKIIAESGFDEFFNSMCELTCKHLGLLERDIICLFAKFILSSFEGILEVRTGNSNTNEQSI